ncbi:DNA-binding protein [Clostridia bacterium]|nr:DNA-binding protein [Clostridia bacterium]
MTDSLPLTVLLDTNVIMDALQERSPFDVAAKEILIRSERGELTCGFTANTMTDVFYLYSKSRDASAARTALAYLLAKYDVVTVTKEDCIQAMKLPVADFEDALVAVCAEKFKADYIVTRDELFLSSKSPVKLISPGDLLDRIYSQGY